jgi:sulfur-carrier protein adenylyltransferase/sulfurtransferase
MISDHDPDEITILDVRQPGEYKDSHIPGAVLIPLAELSDRASELDPDKPTLVY